MVPSLSIPADATLVVLSPHLDDAILSCGALLADAAARRLDVLVITVFNGRPTTRLSSAAQRFHARCGLADELVMKEREREDDAALATIGARTVRLGQPEALYRHRPDGAHWYAADDAIFVPEPEPLAEPLPNLARLIADHVCKAEPALVVAPLAIGGHVDHRIVARAAAALSYPVVHYEDVPYVLYDHNRDWPTHIQVAHPQLHSSTDAGWAAKLNGIDCYRSQRDVLWHHPETWREELTAYASELGGDGPAERYWAKR